MSYDNGELWITGGYVDVEFKNIDMKTAVNAHFNLKLLHRPSHIVHGHLSSSTQLFDEKHIKLKPGPNLPIGRARHCTIVINDQYTLIYGGMSEMYDKFNNSISIEGHIYNATTQQFSDVRCI